MSTAGRLPIPVLQFLISIWFCTALSLFSPAAAQDLSFLSDSTNYLWPTDASSYISSTFGETRSEHLHAGLDIRTWGREGYRVFATRDGTVYRLIISPTGYGKVIFLRHDDGSFSLYAHLSRFEESLMELADSLRMKEYSFLLNRDVSEMNLKVKQGDLIGYTGSTGIGPPHLHFELRTPDNAPFNPLLTNISVEDHQPPVFTGLAVEHLNSETLHVQRTEVRTPQKEGASFDFDTLQVQGPVGLSVDVHDRADRTPNLYAVYELTLVSRQDTLFHSRVDGYSYSKASQMFIDRVYPLLKTKRQGFQRMFLVNGNEFPFYKTGKTRGIVDLPEGVHELKVIAKDYYGNRSVASILLEVSQRQAPPRDEIASIPAYPQKPAGIHPAEQIAFSLPQKISTEERLLTEQRSSGPSPEPDDFEASILFSREKNSGIQRSTKKLVPGKRQILHLPDQRVWLDFPEDALFDTLHVEMISDHTGEVPTIRFLPSDVPLQRPATLNIIPKEEYSSSVVGIFSYDPVRNRHRYRGSGSTASILRARISDLSELQLLEDRVQPYTGKPIVEVHPTGFTLIHIPVEDRRSGIDYRRSRIEINGKRGIVEYDPDKERLTWYQPGFQLTSESHLEFWVYDRMGNLTHRRQQIRQGTSLSN